MYFKHSYNLKYDANQDTVIYVSYASSIDKSELKDLKYVECNFKLENRLKDHNYFWRKDSSNNIYLFSFKDPCILFEEKFMATIDLEKQAYEYTREHGLLFVQEYLNSMENYANEYSEKNFNNDKNVIIYKHENKFGYIIYRHFPSQNLKEIDDNKFLLIISDKEYEFKNFNKTFK